MKLSKTAKVISPICKTLFPLSPWGDINKVHPGRNKFLLVVVTITVRFTAVDRVARCFLQFFYSSFFVLNSLSPTSLSNLKLNHLLHPSTTPTLYATSTTSTLKRYFFCNLNPGQEASNWTSLAKLRSNTLCFFRRDRCWADPGQFANLRLSKSLLNIMFTTFLFMVSTTL